MNILMIVLSFVIGLFLGCYFCRCDYNYIYEKQDGEKIVLRGNKRERLAQMMKIIKKNKKNPPL